MFSLLFGGLGDFVAPRPRFEDEVASLLRGGNYDRALALLKQSHNTKLLNNLDKSGLAPIHIASACGAIVSHWTFLSFTSISWCYVCSVLFCSFS